MCRAIQDGPPDIVRMFTYTMACRGHYQALLPLSDDEAPPPLSTLTRRDDEAEVAEANGRPERSRESLVILETGVNDLMVV